LSSRIAGIRGKDDTSATTVYAIGFKRTGTVFSATIRVGGTSVRILNARGQSCAALAQATAVTLAMLVDADEAAEPPPLSATEPRPEPKLIAAPALVMPARANSEVAVGLSLGAAVLAGVLGPIAPALVADGGLQVARFRIGLGALWGLPRSISLAPGSVRESLFAGTVRGCFGLAGSRRLRFDLCSGVFAGAVAGKADGFTDNLTHRRPWLVIPVELSLARRSGPVGWELTASALVAVVEHDFAVDNVGVAYRSSPVGGMLSLRGLLTTSP
jgi:hypothetical protein